MIKETEFGFEETRGKGNQVTSNLSLFGLLKGIFVDKEVASRSRK